jgi:hypothetical protein
MKKIVRLTESDLKKIIMKTINEDLEMMDVSSDSGYYKLRKRKIEIPFDEVARLYHFASKYCYGKENFPDCREIEDVANKYNLRW